MTDDPPIAVSVFDVIAASVVVYGGYRIFGIWGVIAGVLIVLAMAFHIRRVAIAQYHREQLEYGGGNP